RCLDPFAPGALPMAALAAAVHPGSAQELAAFSSAIGAEAALAANHASAGLRAPAPKALLRAVDRRRGWRRRLVLVLDQLEEAAQADAIELQAFLCLLKVALMYDDRLVVVATVRSDLVGHFLDGPSADLFEHQEVLRPMSQAQLRRVIR